MEKRMENETVQTQQTESTTGGTPQSTDRAAVYATYYNQSQEGSPGEPQTVAQTAPPTEPEQAQAPATAVAPAQAIEDRLKAQEASISAIAEAMKALAESVKPKQPDPPAAEPTSITRWIELLKEGKAEEATELLAQTVAQRTGQVDPKILIQHTLEQARAERDVDEFLANIRSTNKDLEPMEDMILFRTNRLLDAVAKTKDISSPLVWAKEYKAAVSQAVEDTRKVFLTLRGDGKQEAAVRTQEVLAGAPLPPNGIDTNRGTTVKPSAPAEQSVADYIAERNARQLRGRGMVVG